MSIFWANLGELAYTILYIYICMIRFKGSDAELPRSLDFFAGRCRRWRDMHSINTYMASDFSC